MVKQSRQMRGRWKRRARAHTLLALFFCRRYSNRQHGCYLSHWRFPSALWPVERLAGSSIKEVAYRGAARWQADDTSHQLFVCEYGAECAAERCGVCDAEGVVEDEMGW